jgi:hypothetical protein
MRDEPKPGLPKTGEPTARPAIPEPVAGPGAGGTTGMSGTPLGVPGDGGTS